MQKTPHARLGARDVSHDPDRRTGGAPRDGRLAPARLGAFFAPMTRTLTPTFKRDRASRRADRPRASDPDDANAIRESSSTRRVDATTPRRVSLPGTPTSGVERAGVPRHRVSSSPAPPPGSAPPPAVASERWVTRFMAFKCVHLDPMADERAAQLSARVRAQTASIAKVKHHLSTYDANGATASDGSFRPKPSKSTRRVVNVTAFLAAVAEKKFIAKKERRARRRSRLSTVSDDEEGAASARARAQRQAARQPQGRPGPEPEPARERGRGRGGRGASRRGGWGGGEEKRRAARIFATRTSVRVRGVALRGGAGGCGGARAFAPRGRKAALGRRRPAGAFEKRKRRAAGGDGGGRARRRARGVPRVVVVRAEGFRRETRRETRRGGFVARGVCHAYISIQYVVASIARKRENALLRSSRRSAKVTSSRRPRRAPPGR